MRYGKQLLRQRSMPVATQTNKETTQRKRVARLQFVFEKRRSDKKEDGWEASLLRGGRGQALLPPSSTAWISLFNDSRVLYFCDKICF